MLGFAGQWPPKPLERGDHVSLHDGRPATLVLGPDSAGDALVWCAIDAVGGEAPVSDRYVVAPAADLVRR